MRLRLVLPLLLICIVFSCDGSETPTEIVNRLMQNYSRNEAPDIHKPTAVRLGVYINSFYSINEQTMDYSVSMYLRQAWRDPRLDFTRIDPTIKKIRMAENSWNEIWIPDTFFRNEKGASFHEVTVKNRLLRLDSTGELWYVSKITAVLSCPMQLHRYPFDTQSCPMMFESFGHTMDTMYFAWLDNPVDISNDLQLPQFALVDTNLFNCSQNYTTGAYPCLEIRFILRRNIGYFLIQFYFPSILIVILSWVSFWINVDASHARVTIGLLTVLMMTMISGTASSTLPRVSYIKAIDVWMIICLLFVFTSLIEYAIVNVLARRPAPPTAEVPGNAGAGPRRLLTFWRTGKEKVGRQGPEDVGLATAAAANEAGQEQSATNGKHADVYGGDGRRKVHPVDWFSRIIFPAAFILFNLIYWIRLSTGAADDN